MAGAKSTDVVRLLLHVEGHALPDVEGRLLHDFEATMRALGHTVERHYNVDQGVPSRILWVLNDSSDSPGAIPYTNDPIAAYTRLQTMCVYIDLLYIHGNSPHAQDTYDQLLALPWHETAYCFDSPRGDLHLLAKVLATLLSNPCQRRLSQPEAEQIMRII
ncbi:hypothetical protein H257_00837 [Aphanomyces astaci]|uniref:Uncharacterized protein n=1 Tax=Aphanomyces astaci TaxID=112090 RepID=W4HER0_APHAT|nr:hypothetical protein H257_00837 [Aphanomyces astaci]ETV89633.1 hypothetical protein H257_00837 [Aphanomyces astaci]|eukprot:XP_009822033.1 hypothetical protein H257_00837 [Aphanomyces astaci]